jgi:hypothetical protein
MGQDQPTPPAECNVPSTRRLQSKKQTTGLTEDGLPVHSFRSLLADLATLARNTITTAITPNHPLTVLTRPTPIQQKAFDLLAIKCSHMWTAPSLQGVFAVF